MNPGAKILFLTYDGLTDPLGQSQILPYFIGLSKKGYRITILSCEKTEAFQKNHDIIKQLVDEHGINWQYHFYTKKPPVLSTFSDLRKMKQMAVQLHAEHHFSIVHCRTILTAGIGRKLQELGVKFIFDIRGFWADERVDGNLWSLKNPLYRLIYKRFKKKEKESYQGADAVITLTRNAKAHLVKQFGVLDANISVVPCTADLKHFSVSAIDEVNKNALKKKLGLTDKHPLVCYSGSLGTRYLIHQMLDCFAEISRHFPKAHFLIVTHSDTGQLEAHAAKLGIRDRISLTASTYSDIPTYISLADVALYFIYAGNSGKAVSPTKQAEFLGLGIPIITNSEIGDSTEIIEGEGAGLIVRQMDLPHYSLVAEGLESLLKKDKNSITEVAQKYFDLEEGIKTYTNVYQRL